MAKLGIAVVGTKGMGRGHLRAILDTKGFILRAVCDVVPAEAEAAGKQFGVPGFTNHREMLRADPAIRALSIATPHWFHPAIAVDCAKAKVHVLTEKPMSVTVRDADRMIAAHRKAGTILAVVYQHRFTPLNAKARQLVARGRLGPIHRVMLLAPGFRTNAYYASAAWRATWKGEGGGVLLNQAPHHLDLVQWISGLMPSKVYSINESFLHPIEVEDRASALLTYPGGATGYLHASTTELPGRVVIEIAGDRGLLRLEGGQLKFARLKKPLRAFCRSTRKAWSAPEVVWEDIKLPEAKRSGHRAVFEDFRQAIVRKRKPMVTGEEGRNSVELANAMILSSFSGRPVKVPVNRAAYARLMQKLIAQSGKAGRQRSKRT